MGFATSLATTIKKRARTKLTTIRVKPTTSATVATVLAVPREIKTVQSFLNWLINILKMMLSLAFLFNLLETVDANLSVLLLNAAMTNIKRRKTVKIARH